MKAKKKKKKHFVRTGSNFLTVEPCFCASPEVNGLELNPVASAPVPSAAWTQNQQRNMAGLISGMEGLLSFFYI